MNVILTGSQKNNIGKTIISIKIGIELAKMDKRVLMMDLSQGKIKMSEYLRVNENIIYDIVDVFNKTCDLEQGVIEIIENLSLLPCPRLAGKINDINKDKFIGLIDSAVDYDYVIIDADRLTSTYIDFLKVQNAITINNNDFSCVKEINSDKTISSKAKNFIVLINMYNKKAAKKGTMLRDKDLEKLTETTVKALIEENPKYSKIQYEMFFQEDFMKTEISNIINNLK